MAFKRATDDQHRWLAEQIATDAPSRLVIEKARQLVRGSPYEAILFSRNKLDKCGVPSPTLKYLCGWSDHLAVGED